VFTLPSSLPFGLKMFPSRRFQDLDVRISLRSKFFPSPPRVPLLFNGLFETLTGVPVLLPVPTGAPPPFFFQKLYWWPQFKGLRFSSSQDSSGPLCALFRFYVKGCFPDVGPPANPPSQVFCLASTHAFSVSLPLPKGVLPPLMYICASDSPSPHITTAPIRDGGITSCPLSLLEPAMCNVADGLSPRTTLPVTLPAPP